MAGRAARTDDLGSAEADADEGVEEGHDGGEEGEPRHLVEAGYLRQDHLREAEEEHVVAVPSHGARRVVAVPVVAVGPLDRPATYTMTENESSENSTRKIHRNFSELTKSLNLPNLTKSRKIHRNFLN